MSQPVPAPLPFELVFDDELAMETYSHWLQMNFLIELIQQAMAERGRTDFFTGGNAYLYYSYEQALAIAEDVATARYDFSLYRGPDIFFVDRVDPRRERKGWVVWEEGGRYPDLIVELVSYETAYHDHTVKKDLYAHVFKTPEYYLYDLDTCTLEGFRLDGDLYQPIAATPQGRLPSEQLGVELGLWPGSRHGQNNTWVRLFHPDGRLVPTKDEMKEAAEGRAEAERQRAEAAEAELARLRARLGEA